MSKEELKKIVTESTPVFIRSVHKDTKLVKVFMSKKAYWKTIDIITDNLSKKILL